MSVDRIRYDRIQELEKENKKLTDEVRQLQKERDELYRINQKMIENNFESVVIKERDKLKEKIEKITKITSEITYEDSDYKDYYHGIKEIQSTIEDNA
jgi:seryl-tRNA synthetase